MPHYQNDPDHKFLTSATMTDRLDQDAHSMSKHHNYTQNPEIQDKTAWSDHDSPWLRRMSAATLYTLFITIPLDLAVLGFLSYLWHAGEENHIWHTIMVRGWATRAITLSGLLLRNCGDLQAGAATAMLAALVLEAGKVPLRDAAVWSIVRASKPRPRTLFFPSLREARLPAGGVKIITTAAVMLLCATLVILQFTSTILLSDLSLGLISGRVTEGQVLYNVEYPPGLMTYVAPGSWLLPPWRPVEYPIPHRISTWQRNPPAYPAFAEYQEPVTNSGGISDTGLLLRAFLPYSDAALRQNLRSYSGKALVLDSRVSCQAPSLTDLTASEVAIWGHFLSPGNVSTDSYSVQQLNGTVSPSKRDVSRLWAPRHGIPFSCTSAVGSPSIGICQLNGARPDMEDVFWNNAGGLISEFVNLTDPREQWNIVHSNRTVGPFNTPPYITWGTPFLMLEAVESGALNVSRDPAWDAHVNNKQPPKWITYPTTSEIQNEPWSMITSASDLHHWKIRASLCYTAWDTETLDVTMSSANNRTEPVAHWSRKQHFNTTPDISLQLGTTTVTNAADRHILQLNRRDSWIPYNADLDPKVVIPFVQAYADVSGNSLTPGTEMGANWTALLTNHNPAKDGTAPLLSALQTVAADDTVAKLFNHFMSSSNKTIAHAFSALITVLSGMAYYDQLPLFHAEANVTEVFFTEVLYPQQTGGFWVVVVLVLIHILLVLAVAVAFLLRSKSSFVGSYWHTAVQLLSDETRSILATSSLQNDSLIRREMRTRLGPDATVQLRVVEEKTAALKVDPCSTDWSSCDRKI